MWVQGGTPRRRLLYSGRRVITGFKHGDSIFTPPTPNIFFFIFFFIFLRLHALLVSLPLLLIKISNFNICFCSFYLSCPILEKDNIIESLSIELSFLTLIVSIKQGSEM